MTIRRLRLAALVAAAAALFSTIRHGGGDTFSVARLDAQAARGAGAAPAPGGPAPAAPTPPDVEWRTYGSDLASSRYSPLDQINAANFNSLQVAWRFRTASLGPREETNLEATPLMVGGVIYTVAGSRRSVVALDATTGELLWVHREDEG